MKSTIKTIKHSSENTTIGKFADTGNYILRNPNDIPRGDPQMLLELSDEDITTGDSVLLPNDTIVVMTDNDMIHYLASESIATKKIIASYPELPGVTLFNKTFVTGWINSENIEISHKAQINELMNKDKERVYYAHPMCTYNTILEKFFIEYIQSCEPNTLLVNPNNPEHQEGYEREGMEYFKNLVKSCNALYAHGFGDNSIGAGVAKEMDWMKEMGKTVEFFPLFEHSTYQKKLNSSDEFRVLSIEETRAKLKSYME